MGSFLNLRILILALQRSRRAHGYSTAQYGIRLPYVPQHGCPDPIRAHGLLGASVGAGIIGDAALPDETAVDQVRDVVCADDARAEATAALVRVRRYGAGAPLARGRGSLALLPRHLRGERAREVGVRSALATRHYLALENDLHTIARYVEPAKANFNTFSVELTKLFLSACSEVDVVCKLCVADRCPGAKAENMDDYRTALHAAFSPLYKHPITAPKHVLTFPPFATWASNTNPAWWKEHQKVKDERQTHFASASLENSLLSMSALYLLVRCYYEKDRQELVRPDPFFSAPAEGKPAPMSITQPLT